jgi:hypothetical protein
MPMVRLWHTDDEDDQDQMYSVVQAERVVGLHWAKAEDFTGNDVLHVHLDTGQTMYLNEHAGVRLCDFLCEEWTEVGAPPKLERARR